MLMKAQRIQYGKGKSDTVAKLDGTFRIPVTAAAPGKSTELQQSIFNAPGAGSAPKATNGDVAMADGEKGPHGQKRTRDDDEEEDEDAPMEEDEDDAMAMDESDDD